MVRGLHNIPRLQTVCEVLMLNWVAPQSTPTTHSSLEEGGGSTTCRRGPTPGASASSLPGPGTAHRQRPPQPKRRWELALLPHHGAQPRWSWKLESQAAPDQVRVPVRARWRPSWGRGPEEEATGSADSPGSAGLGQMHRWWWTCCSEDVARRASTGHQQARERQCWLVESQWPP